MAKDHVATNQAVLQALGIAQKRVISVNIKLRPEKLPLVVLTVLPGAPAEGVEIQRFRLVLDDQATEGAQEGASDGAH